MIFPKLQEQEWGNVLAGVAWSLRLPENYLNAETSAHGR